MSSEPPHDERSTDEQPNDSEDDEFEDLARRLGNLSPDERERVLEQADGVESDDGVPRVVWGPNPEAIKTTFQFVRENEVVTWEELRQHLSERELTDSEKGKYTFGIVHGDDGDPFFDRSGRRQGDTELWLTPLGERLADVFEGDGSSLDGIERALIMGVQGFESAFTFLDIVGQHRENGIRRENVEEQLVDRYGEKGSHFTGYYRKLFGSLGMIEAKNDPEDGRKVRYFPLYPEEAE